MFISPGCADSGPYFPPSVVLDMSSTTELALGPVLSLPEPQSLSRGSLEKSLDTTTTYSSGVEGSKRHQNAYI